MSFFHLYNNDGKFHHIPSLTFLSHQQWVLKHIRRKISKILLASFYSYGMIDEIKILVYPLTNMDVPWKMFSLISTFPASSRNCSSSFNFFAFI